MRNITLLLLFTLGFGQDYSLEFDGVDDRVDVPSNILDNLSEATLSFKVKTGEESANFILFGVDWDGGQRGFNLSYHDIGFHLGDGTPGGGNNCDGVTCHLTDYFHIYNPGNTNSDIAQDISYDLGKDTWYTIHLVFQGDIKQFDLYIDGNYIASVTHSAWDKIAKQSIEFIQLSSQLYQNFYTK